MAITLARATIAQRTQLGREATYGTPVAANKRLPTLAFHPKPMAEADSYREQGRKFSSVVVPNKEWSTSTFEGAMTYSELAFIFASLFAYSAAVQTGTTPNFIQTWTLKPSNDSPDIPAVFTLEHGDDTASGAIQTAGHVVTDATLDITRQACKISGSTIGLPWVTGQSMTATPTNVENIPITPGSVSAFLDPLFANIGTTKLAKLMSINAQVTGRWQPDWVLDASLPSYADLVEAQPSAKVTIKMQATTQAMALFATFRTGTLAYLRVTAPGPLIVTGTNYNMTFDVPVQVKDLLEFSDEGGVYCVGFDLEPIADDTANFPLQMKLINRQATL